MVNNGFIICVSLIYAGAVGNLIDSMFYGMIFEASLPYTSMVAHIFPEGGGYATFLHGKVVDMFYFPIFSGHFPDWFPFWKGESFVFFRPVFNIADASISVGVASIVLFQRSFFSSEANLNKTEASSEIALDSKSTTVKEETTSVTEEVEMKLEEPDLEVKDGEQKGENDIT